MVFTNVINPRSHVSRKDEYQRTLVRRGATIGANATIVCGVDARRVRVRRRGRRRDDATCRRTRSMVGVPARRIGWMCQCGERLPDSGEGTCAACGSTYEPTGDGIRRTRRSAVSAPAPIVTSAPFASRSSGAGASARITSRRSRSVDGLELVAVCDSRCSARAGGRGGARRAVRSRRYDEMLAEVPMRRRRDLHAVGTASAARHRSRRGRGSTSSREKPMAISLDGGGRARAGVRRRGRAPVRREAEPAQSADPAAQARGRQGALRPDLPGEHARCAGRGRRSTTTRRRGAGRGSSTAARS